MRGFAGKWWLLSAAVIGVVSLVPTVRAEESDLSLAIKPEMMRAVDLFPCFRSDQKDNHA